MDTIQIITKEDHIQIHHKMDAINLQGVWLNFPGIATLGHAKVAAGIYLQLLREEQEKAKRRKRRRKETAKEMRNRLLKEVERRIIEKDDDDLLLILGI